jgi:hypothetical protein
MQIEIKPPLGIVPRNIAITQRMIDIQEAIYRYLDADYIIPQEWIREYFELTKELGRFPFKEEVTK